MGARDGLRSSACLWVAKKDRLTEIPTRARDVLRRLGGFGCAHFRGQVDGDGAPSLLLLQEAGLVLVRAELEAQPEVLRRQLLRPQEARPAHIHTLTLSTVVLDFKTSIKTSRLERSLWMVISYVRFWRAGQSPGL